MNHTAEEPENAAETPLDLTSAPTLEEALKRIAELEQQAAEQKDKMMRALAEAENTRRRAEKSQQDMSKFAISGFAKGLISVADNLKRALEAVSEVQRINNPELKNIYEGVAATERELLRLFTQQGITKMEPLGQKFDPNFHEVMFEAPVPGKASGTIIQLVEPGYMIHDRLLRPARVGVAKGEDGGIPEEGSMIDQEI